MSKHQDNSPHSPMSASSDDQLLTSLLHSEIKVSHQLVDSVSPVSSLTNDKQANNAVELMFEYDQLRKEILQNDTLTLQITAFMLLLTTGLMGFAFSRDVNDNLIKAFLFIATDIFAIVGLTQNIDRARTTQIIGSYIKVFIEPKLNEVQWETRLSRFRSKKPKIGDISLIDSQRGIFALISIVSLCLSGYHFYIATQNLLPRYIIVLILLLASVISIFVFWTKWHQYHRIDNENLMAYDRIWEEIGKQHK